MVNDNKIKLLYFVPQFPVLTETFIEREVSKLVELGNLDITVLSFAPGNGVASPNLEGKIVYKRISLLLLLTSLINVLFRYPTSAIAALKLVCGEDKVPLLIPALFSRFNSKASTTSKSLTNTRFIHYLKGIAMTGIIKRYSPSHIHCHFLSEASTFIMVAATILDIPYSVSAHAIDVFVNDSLIPNKARSSAVITVCNGNTWKEVVNLANSSMSSHKIKLLFHGIDADKFLSVEAKQKFTAPFIFCVARLVEKKGLRYLIDASEILKDRGIDHLVKIAGGGPMYDELNQYIAKKELQNNVEILGDGNGIPNKDVASYLKIADIYTAPFILSSTGDVDGVPTTVIEASLAKVPIVATDSGGMSDLVTPDTGLIVPQKDAVALADAFETLIKDPAKRSLLGNAAYKQASVQFNLDKNVRELESMLIRSAKSDNIIS